MAIDVEQLHRVVEGRVRGRGIGHTYAKCCEVAALICLNERRIVCDLVEQYHFRYTLEMLLRVLAEYKLPEPTVRLAGREVVYENARIMFAFNDMWDSTRGLGDCAYVDFRAEYQLVPGAKPHFGRHSPENDDWVRCMARMP